MRIQNDVHKETRHIPERMMMRRNWKQKKTKLCIEWHNLNKPFLAAAFSLFNAKKYACHFFFPIIVSHWLLHMREKWRLLS